MLLMLVVVFILYSSLWSIVRKDFIDKTIEDIEYEHFYYEKVIKMFVLLIDIVIFPISILLETFRLGTELEVIKRVAILPIFLVLMTIGYFEKRTRGNRWTWQ